MDDCTCLIDSEYDGPEPELVVDTIRKAARPWTCEECGYAIVRGERYEETRGKWAGEWEVHRSCLGCANIRKVLCCSGWTYGELLTELKQSDVISPYRTLEPCVLKELSVEGAQKLKRLWMDAVNRTTGTTTGPSGQGREKERS